MTAPLPIHTVLPQLLAALRDQAAAVLVAPPGAGKTTAVAPALLDEPWCDGEILLLSPRRLAARAAAERIAELRGEPVGGTIGYRTRMDNRVSRATRLTVLTPGLFVNRIVGDPELAGVSAVLFDEVHERSLDSDFGLALAIECARAFRPDLRILPMSATIDGARFAALLGCAPVIASEGRAHPLRIVHAGRDPAQRIEDAMAATIRRALAKDAGDCLAFLPGVREIERTAEALAGRLPDGIDLHLLHGTLDPTAQRAALRPAPHGCRKCILATSIAETSLTIDGVRIVVDSGLARRPRFDRVAGIARLVTERASLASITQRAGRAARQGPGVAWRLWAEAGEGGLLPFDPPEIMESDLAPLLLSCARFGEGDPARLPWLDPLPAAGIAEARARLLALGALDDAGRATALGEAMATLPLAPPLAAMLLKAAGAGQAGLAAEVAVLIEERGLGGRDADLDQRLGRWRGQRGGKADAARGLARRWAKLAEAAVMSGGAASPAIAAPLKTAPTVGALVALAFPDRLAKRRGASGEDWLSVGGRGFRLDPASPLARADWLAIADAAGAAGGARILSAAVLADADVPLLFADRIEVRRTVRWLADADRVEALAERRLGAIRLAAGPDPAPDAEAIAAALVDAVRQGALDRLPWSDAARGLRRRAGYAGSDRLADAGLTAEAEDWLKPLLAGRRRLIDVDPSALSHALDLRLGWDEKARIDRLAPAQFVSPAGTRHDIAWDAAGGPTVELRVQALYGLAEHPCVGSDRVPLILSLTSPAGRPIQTTRDLPGFWAGSWRDVAKDMRGRYPRHDWPDDPATALPSLRTKKAQARGARAPGA